MVTAVSVGGLESEDCTIIIDLESVTVEEALTDEAVKVIFIV